MNKSAIPTIERLEYMQMTTKERIKYKIKQLNVRDCTLTERDSIEPIRKERTKIWNQIDILREVLDE